MIQLYINYWKNSFKYKETVSINEFLTVFIFNLIILAVILLMGIFVPVTWENVLVDFWYIVMYLMIIPTISLIIRMVRKLVKK
ncbi:hypothetical protein ACTX2D_002711 [Enterococcus hirae]